MIKTNFSFRRLLDTFVPGFIVIISIWYLFKPFINKFFPIITFSPQDNYYFGNIKLILFIVLSFFFGMIINHFSDIPISLMFPNRESEKFNRPFKRIAYSLFGLFSWTNRKDPRLKAIDRYLSSNRAKIFESMLEEWGFSNRKLIEENKQEKIIAHQHISTRLKALNKQSLNIFNTSFDEVQFSSSLFTSIIISLLISIISLIINNSISIYEFSSDTKFINKGTLISIILLEYLLSIIMSFSLKRRFTHFSSQILTIALHFYAKINKSKLTHRRPISRK